MTDIPFRLMSQIQYFFIFHLTFIRLLLLHLLYYLIAQPIERVLEILFHMPNLPISFTPRLSHHLKST